MYACRLQSLRGSSHCSSDGIHLKQCVTLYVFALPFTLISDLGWAMIPVVTIVAFTLMGIEGIADEIEMPFGGLSNPCDMSVSFISTLFGRPRRF